MPATPPATDDPSLSGFQPFPPVDLEPVTPSGLSRAFEARLSAEGLPAIDVAKLVGDSETRFTSARDDQARRRVNHAVCLALASQANRATQGSADKRRWQGLVRVGSQEAVTTRWFLLDDAQLATIESSGRHIRFTRVLRRGLVSVPFALVFWAAAYAAYQNGTQTNIALAVGAWVAWFGVRSYVRRKNTAAPKR